MESFGGSEFGGELGGDVSSAEGLVDDTEAFGAGFNEAETNPDAPDDAGTESQGLSGPESSVELAGKASPENLSDDPEAFGHAFHEANAETEPETEGRREAEAQPTAETQEPLAEAEAEPVVETEPVGQLEGEDQLSGPSLADRVDLSTRQQLELAQAEVARDARDFTDDDEASQFGAEHWNEYAENLPAPQDECVYDYTVEPPHPEGKPTYREINGYLRTGDNWSPEVQRHIDELDAALEGNPVPEDLVISRATNLDHLGVQPRKMPGLTFHEDGYLSTSLGSTAEAFEDKEAVLHLRVPKGTPALWVERSSDYGNDERELLLGRGRDWRADRVIKDPDSGKWHIFGAVLPEGDDK